MTPSPSPFEWEYKTRTWRFRVSSCDAFKFLIYVLLLYFRVTVWPWPWLSVSFLFCTHFYSIFNFGLQRACFLSCFLCWVVYIQINHLAKWVARTQIITQDLNNCPVWSFRSFFSTCSSSRMHAYSLLVPLLRFFACLRDHAHLALPPRCQALQHFLLCSCFYQTHCEAYYCLV